MVIQQEIILQGPHGKPILLDYRYTANQQPKPIVVFTHGFKGFKDWGHFNVLADAFAEAGFVFVKYNLSHNGTTPERPNDFVDLEAFGRNTFSIELDDLGAVIDWAVETDAMPKTEKDTDQLYLIGHSRGGGLTILKAAEDARVKKIATWASVAEFGHFWTPEVMDQWKKEGVQYVINGRTGQEMPMYYDLYDDYAQNMQRLHIPTAARSLTIPHLIAHAKDDPAVSFAAAEELHAESRHSELLAMEDGGHTFGGKHPWASDTLAPQMETVLQETVAFFRKASTI